MPTKSQAQFRYFKWLEHNPEEAKKHSISTEKAGEMTQENKGSKSYSHLPEKKKRFKKLL